MEMIVRFVLITREKKLMTETSSVEGTFVIIEKMTLCLASISLATKGVGQKPVVRVGNDHQIRSNHTKLPQNLRILLVNAMLLSIK